MIYRKLGSWQRNKAETAALHHRVSNMPEPTCAAMITIQMKNSDPSNQNAKTAYQHEQMLFCCNHASVCTVGPYWGALATNF